MADNVPVTPGTGATIATDDVSGIQFQKVKLDAGGDGLTVPVIAGQQAMAASLPVVLASDQTALSISSHAVTNAGTFAVQADVTKVAGTATDVNSGTKSAGTLRVVLATDQPQLTNKLLVTPDANSAVNVAQINGVTPLMGNGVTGTGSQRVTIASDNTAFAVNSTLSAETTKVIGTIRIASGGVASGSIASGAIASGAVASGAFASGALASGSIAAGAVAAGATSFVKLEDVASADADAGVPAMAVRKASPANTSGTDGDYEMLQISAGRLWASAVIDTALPAGTNLLGKLGIDQTTVGTTNAVSLAQLGTTTVDSNSGVKSAGTLRVVLATDQPALTNKLLVTPDSVALPANQSVNLNQAAGTALDVNSGTKSAGTIRVVLATDQPALTNKLLVTPDSVALPANQSVNVSQINAVTPLMGNGTTGTGSQRVTIASDNTAFSVNATLAAGTATVGAAFGFSGTATTTVTRPGDTAAYAANDAWADSTSAPTAGGFTLSNMGRVSGGSGVITDIMFISNTDPATLLQGELWIYDSAATATNDNAAFASSDADSLLMVAVVPFTLVSTQAGSGANSYVHVQNLSIGYTCVGTANLRFKVKVKNAYTPANAETLTVRAKFIQTN